jgi:uncharacterized protein
MMAKDFDAMDNSNNSSNPSIHDVSQPERRQIIKGGLGGVLTGLLAPLGANGLAGCATIAQANGGSNHPLSAGTASFQGVAGARGQFSFKGVPVSIADRVTVPEGYTAQVLTRWGDPVGIVGNMPSFKTDASNSALDQAAQFGMHHDAIHYFPLGDGEQGSRRGLLVMNHEYTDDGLLHPGGLEDWTAEKTQKSINAHGVSVCEVSLRTAANGATQWEVVRPSIYARRITTATPMSIAGPAAGHPLMQTAADPAGKTILGTLNNCAHGVTPWGTYLACEENWSFYFQGPEQPDADQKRYGARKAWYPWGKTEERFDLTKTPNEFNRFGWVCEIDPNDPTSTPIKHTAMGRGAYECSTIGQLKDGRVVAFIGEDSRFEYIYKFVSRDAVKPGGFAANKTVLDHGTLYVARFDSNNTGRWIELTAGKNGLNADKGFATQAEVVIRNRQAADLVGGTKMDRPEWITIDPKSGQVYCTLTNNSRRGDTKEGQPLDAANPRANNVMGNIIRWKQDGDFDATTFTWNHFVLAGDPANTRLEAKGNINGDIFACPDGLWFDPMGRLWVCTDMHATQMNKGEMANIGNNMLLAANADTGEIRRFLTGPVNCEITGTIATPDMRSLFVNIQHPGETPSDRSDPKEPAKYSTWPDGTGRPRSATIVIRRIDGGIIGS